MELYPFYYEHENRSFALGDNELSLDDPDLERELRFTEGLSVDREDILYLSGYGAPVNDS